MDLKLLLTVFACVFVAEIGDKTPLATLLFAANNEASRLAVFAGAALALVLVSGIAVLAGGLVSQHVSPRHLNMAAGLGVVAIGLWTLLKP